MNERPATTPYTIAVVAGAVVYGIGGLWLAIFALRVLVGSAAPLPL